MRTSLRVGAGLLLIAVLTLVGVRLANMDDGPSGDGQGSNAPGQMPRDGSNTATGTARGVADRAHPTQDPVGPRSSATPPTGTDELTEHDATLARAIDALEASTKYPPTSRLISEHPELARPRYVEPRLRLLGSAAAGVQIVLKQDRLFVGPGEVAVATIELADKSRSLRVQSAEVSQVRSGDDRGARRLDAMKFSDDGTLPDVLANDGIFTAAVRPDALVPPATTADLLVSADVAAGPASGEVTFRLIYTGETPAAFTGLITDAAVAGSLVLRVGVKVARPGSYRMLGRLYDDDGRAVALLKFDGRLSATTSEVEFTAYGKLLRDANGRAPFRLRDVEGWRQLEGASPDRQVMPLWAGPYETRRYPQDTWTDKTWDSPTKARRIDVLRQRLRN